MCFYNLMENLLFMVLIGDILFNTQEVLIRLNPNGEQDTTFSKVKLNVGNNLGTINSFLLQPDGKIVIGGTFSDINNRQFSKLARILPNGEIDSAFKPKPDREVRSVKLQTDGKILVGGLFRFINRDTVNGMARLQSSGLLDSTFKLPGVPEQKEIMAIDIQADGKIIVCGSRNSVKGGDMGLHRPPAFQWFVRYQFPFRKKP